MSISGEILISPLASPWLARCRWNPLAMSLVTCPQGCFNGAETITHLPILDPEDKTDNKGGDADNQARLGGDKGLGYTLGDDVDLSH